MLDLSGEEEESESESNNNIKDKNNINNNIKEEKKVVKNTDNNKNITKISSKESDNFFKDDSDEYEIISDNNDEKNNINNNKEKKENDVTEEELNLTDIDDKDDFIYDNNKKDNNNNNKQTTQINNNLNNIKENNNLENKDNNNNIPLNNSLNQNKDNNSESSNKEIQRNINSINYNSNNKTDKKSIGSQKSKNSENYMTSSEKSRSQKDSFSKEDVNDDKNNNDKNKDLNNNNNKISNKININNNEEEEESESINNKKEEKKEDIISLNKENNNKINNIQNNNIDKKIPDKLSKNDISSIKDNLSSNNKENSQDDIFSFSSRSNSENNKKKKNKANSIENKQIKNDKKEEEIIIEMPKKVDLLKKKISDSIYEITYVKDEYYIKYIKLKRKGFKDIVEKNYIQGLSIFSECYELSSKHLKDKIKQIDSLINMSICQYYNGNFSSMVYLLSSAKKIFDTVSLGQCHISPRDKIRLGIKLFTYSSMSNLSTNNYEESIDDIKSAINLIEPENDFYKKLSLFKYVLYTLFKVETLLNIKNENEIITNINKNFNYNLSDKNLINLNESKNTEIIDIDCNNQTEKIMQDFLACLKYKNFLIILNSFIENASSFKKNKNLPGYYFCIFNQYLITYNNEIKINNEEQIKDIKNRLYICYKNLMGEEMAKEIKEKNRNKNIIKFIKEFNGKMECAFEIFNLLENYEKKINKQTQDFYKEKNENKFLINNKNKNKLKNKEESPYFAKLCLKYSLNYLTKKKNELQNDKTKESKESIDNINLLIKELEILLSKISSYEIDISFIRKKNIKPEIIKNINILFENLIYIYYKSLLYRNFHKFYKKTLNIKLTENFANIDSFLTKNYDIITKDMRLIKINYGSKGHKFYFYRIDNDSNTLSVRSIENEPYPLMSFNLFKDVTKITYGIRSKNLIGKLKDKNKGDPDTRKLLRAPWRFISFILKKKSVDLYCEDEQVDNWFYGMKDFTRDNSVEYKILSTNKFVLNKIKYRIAIKLKVEIDNGNIVEEKSVDLISKLIKEKAFHNISFSKLILLYNKLMSK